VLCLSPATIAARLLSAAAKNTAWTFTATIQTHAQATQVQPRRTTGWYLPVALFFGQRDTRSAPNTALQQPARANGAAMWRSIKNYLRDQAGIRILDFDLIITHERFGSSSHPQNRRLTHPQDIDAPLHIAAQRKINSCRQQYADNQAAAFLACTRPPDFVASRRSVTVFCARTQFFSTRAATPVCVFSQDADSRAAALGLLAPSFRRVASSAGFLTSSFGGLHHFEGLLTHHQAHLSSFLVISPSH
jgi:hypothetical protein